ncbi:hypothetical protein HO133_010910 [Letharia lupina]|uniref:Uncharacterized protein n=1 Tax=Letharia lupina TaxID=560253 RepID=A0A8H6CIY9_9LECA|nr:uncharacterized protein HO133_010910 [Letharia lupina]KAF6224333.1 hypothetical protein HO133_010910 [Letharia lupina]
MAYQESSYGPRSTYAGPTNNAPHFPQSHQQHSHSHSQFYPNPYPHSTQSNASSPPLPSYTPPQPSEGQTYHPQRLPYGPNQIHNVGGLSTQPPMTAPDDHFKKPYLPQQQYMNHGQPPANFIDHQRQKSSSAVSELAPAQAYSGASTTPQRLHTSSSSYPPTSTMTVTAAPINPPSTQSTPTSEVPSQSADPALQPGGLSSLDQQRVDALLQVNNLLLQEVTILQKVGFKPSPQSPQQTAPPNTSSPQATPAPPTSAGDPTSTTQNQNNSVTKTNPTVSTPTTTTPTTATAPQQPSLNTKKYVEFMTRIKTNIMFLVSISDQAKDKPRLPYPSHLEAPPLWLNPGNEEGDRQLDLLREEYTRLRELWPDWKPEVRKPQVGGQPVQQGLQQGLQQMQQPQVQQQS